MPIRWTALALAGTLTLSTLASAAPHQRPQPHPSTPPPAVLSRAEQLCEGLGSFTMAWGLNRDRGFGLFEALRRSRDWDRRHGVTAPMQAIHEAIIRAVYSAPTVAPMTLRQLTEAACAEQIAAGWRPGARGRD